MTEDDIRMWREVGFDYTRPPPPPVVVDAPLPAVEPHPWHKNGTGVCSLGGVREAQRQVEEAVALALAKARAVTEDALVMDVRSVRELNAALLLLGTAKAVLRAREEARR